MVEVGFERIKAGKDIEYVIIPEQRRVVCRLLNCETTAIRRILKYSNAEYVNKTYLIEDTFVGVAKCSPEDEFDVEFGMKLALGKAKRKRCKAVNNMVNKYIKDVQNALSTLAKYGIHNVPELPNANEANVSDERMQV